MNGINIFLSLPSYLWQATMNSRILQLSKELTRSEVLVERLQSDLSQAQKDLASLTAKEQKAHQDEEQKLNAFLENIRALEEDLAQSK